MQRNIKKKTRLQAPQAEQADTHNQEFLSFSANCVSCQHPMQILATRAHTHARSRVKRVCHVNKGHALYQSGPPCYHDLGSICNLSSPEAATIEQGGALPCVDTHPPQGKPRALRNRPRTPRRPAVQTSGSRSMVISIHN